MLERFLPDFSEFVTEGYNAKLPDDINAYRNLDAFLTKEGFERRDMPTSVPQQRRFMYSKGNKNVIVMVYYAGRDIYVSIPGRKTEAKLAQSVLDDFINDHIIPYIREK